MAGRRHTKMLLVEGLDDRAAVANLLDAVVPWGDRREDWPVDIRPTLGVELLLAPDFIRTQLKSAEARHLGVVLDADDDPSNRWARVRREALDAFPGLPDELPADGLVASTLGSRGRTPPARRSAGRSRPEASIRCRRTPARSQAGFATSLNCDSRQKDRAPPADTMGVSGSELWGVV